VKNLLDKKLELPLKEPEFNKSIRGHHRDRGTTGTQSTGRSSIDLPQFARNDASLLNRAKTFPASVQSLRAGTKIRSAFWKSPPDVPARTGFVRELRHAFLEAQPN